MITGTFGCFKSNPGNFLRLFQGLFFMLIELLAIKDIINLPPGFL
ncbi:MAG: hypothetical protein ABRQ39_25255 [Candidatus Eremiobacterota bacterium]